MRSVVPNTNGAGLSGGDGKGMQSNETSEAKKVEENYLAMLSVLNTTTEAVKSANATGNVAVINVAKMSEMT